MIKYALKCEHDHIFESWFSSSEDFEKLNELGLIECPNCGSVKIEKSLMAPKIKSWNKQVHNQDKKNPHRTMSSTPAVSDPTVRLSETSHPQEQLFKALRKKIAEEYEYTGNRFEREIRLMYDGQAETRPIYGKATLEQTKKLVEEGYPVLPLPFDPRKQLN